MFFSQLTVTKTESLVDEKNMYYFRKNLVSCIMKEMSMLLNLSDCQSNYMPSYIMLHFLTANKIL